MCCFLLLFCDLLPFTLVYIFLFIYFAFIFLSFSFRIAPLCFYSVCHRRGVNLRYNLYQFILCCSFFVFDDLYFTDSVVTGLVLC